MIFTRGLAALTLLFVLTLTLEAKFLYKDDVIFNDRFAEQIEAYGQELFDKTGVSLYLAIERDLEHNQTISDYEKETVLQLQQPCVMLTFVEMQRKVDIFARPVALYKDFDKQKTLSPNATFAEAVASALLFGRSLEAIKELLGNYGGTILPILAEKTKGGDTVKKYSVAMYNGYADLADQIAASHGVKLSASAGSGSKLFLDLLRLLFYGIILFVVFRYVQSKLRKRKGKDEQ